MSAPRRMNRPHRMNAAKAPPMFPHVVTIYNTTIETDKTTFEDKITNHITVLHGVLLDASKAVNVRTSGLEGADAANLYIPFTVDAVDGITGEKKRYIPPVEFWRAEDKSGFWTLAISSKEPDIEGNTFFVKGEVVEPDLSTETIEMMYDHVYDITKIDVKDFGGLPHFEIGAK